MWWYGGMPPARAASLTRTQSWNSQPVFWEQEVHSAAVSREKQKLAKGAEDLEETSPDLDNRERPRSRGKEVRGSNNHSNWPPPVCLAHSGSRVMEATADKTLQGAIWARPLADEAPGHRDAVLPLCWRQGDSETFFGELLLSGGWAPAAVQATTCLEPYAGAISRVARHCSLSSQKLFPHRTTTFQKAEPQQDHLYPWPLLTAWQKWSQQHLPNVPGSPRVISQLPLTSLRSTDVSLHSQNTVRWRWHMTKKGKEVTALSPVSSWTPGTEEE